MDQEPRPSAEQQIPRPRAAVVWGCTEHRTPAGQVCHWCDEQDELFTRTDAAPNRKRTTTTRPAHTSPTTEERCLGCGEGDGVRWDDSAVGRDTLRWTDCGHDWTVLIDEPSPAPSSEVG